MPDIVGNPMDYFHVGQQVAGNSGMETFVNTLTQRWNDYNNLRMQAQAKGLGAEQETLGQFRAYTSPEAQKLFGDSGIPGSETIPGSSTSGIGTPIASPAGGSRYSGGFVPTSYDTKIGPFRSIHMENPGYEAEKARTLAEQASGAPLSAEKVATIESGMQRWNPMNIFSWGAGSSNDPKAMAIIRTMPLNQAADTLKGYVDSNEMRPDIAANHLLQKSQGRYVSISRGKSTGKFVGHLKDGSTEYIH